MGKLKNILFMDVDNPNEKADGPIALRISAIVMMIYLAVISVMLVMVHRVLWIVGNLLFVLIYGHLIGMTYRNHTRKALIWYNVVTVAAVCSNVCLIGWNSGIQHFLFVLVLMDLIFTTDNAGTVKKIELILNSYGKYKGLCANTFVITLNYSDFSDIKEIVSPID